MLNFVFVYAITNPVLPAEVGAGAGEPIVGRIISAVLGFFLIGGFIMAFLHLILGAIAWVTASGDKQKLQNAQDRITQAIVGLIIMAAVWAVMLLLSTFTGLKFPVMDLPTFLDTSGNNTWSPNSPLGPVQKPQVPAI